MARLNDIGGGEARLAKNAAAPGRKRRALPAGHEGLRRMASIAIARNHSRALAQYLKSGLNPDAARYEGGWPETSTLIEAAAASDSLECFLMLRAAGAKEGFRSMNLLFLTPMAAGDRKCRILRHLLATGELNPNGEAADGFTCVEMACMTSDDSALNAVWDAQAKIEARDILSSVSGPAGAPRRRIRSL